MERYRQIEQELSSRPLGAAVDDADADADADAAAAAEEGGKKNGAKGRGREVEDVIGAAIVATTKAVVHSMFAPFPKEKY